MFNCCPFQFSTITYKLILSRLYDFYLLYIILPVIALSFLFLAVFYIPSEAGERMGFGVSILLSITVYILVLSEKVPENSRERSALGTCFTCIIYILSVALSFALMTMKLVNRKEKPPNCFLKLTGQYTKTIYKSSAVDTDYTNDYGDISLTPRHQIVKPDKNHNEHKEEKTDYKEEWKVISKYLDKRLSILFFVIIVCLPVFTILPLPRNGLSI